MTDGGERVRIRATVAYDGAQFHGFAEQPETTTVGGTLRSALQKRLGPVDEFTCAGRTDAGVHGWGQVVHFDASVKSLERLTLEQLQRSLNKELAPTIVVRSLSEAAPDFDARFSAKARRYRYLVLNAELPDPFLASTAWWLPDPLNVGDMNAACESIIGEHDFTSFCRRPKGNDDALLTRRVISAKWEPAGDNGLVQFEIEANAFCHQMVRALTGMLVEIGKGNRAVEDMQLALAAQDRAAAASLAPPHGLCLREVKYEV